MDSVDPETVVTWGRRSEKCTEKREYMQRIRHIAVLRSGHRWAETTEGSCSRLLVLLRGVLTKTAGVGVPRCRMIDLNFR